MTYNVVLVSGVRQSESVYTCVGVDVYTHTHIPSFSDPFPVQSITEYWVDVPLLYGRSLGVISFIYGSVYIISPALLKYN